MKVKCVLYFQQIFNIFKGYTAPELYEDLWDGESKRECTKAVDVFSLGCVFFFALTKTHMFSAPKSYSQSNIQSKHFKADFGGFKKLQNKWEIEIVEKLIKSMTQTNPSHRPSAEQVLGNAFFWNFDKIRKFLETSNDFVKRIEYSNIRFHQTIISNFQATQIFNNDWLQAVDPEIKYNLESFGRYDGKCNISLLQAARNSVS